MHTASTSEPQFPCFLTKSWGFWCCLISNPPHSLTCLLSPAETANPIYTCTTTEAQPTATREAERLYRQVCDFSAQFRPRFSHILSRYWPPNRRDSEPIRTDRYSREYKTNHNSKNTPTVQAQFEFRTSYGLVPLFWPLKLVSFFVWPPKLIPFLGWTVLRGKFIPLAEGVFTCSTA
jgi:hypothetical protein